MSDYKFDYARVSTQDQDPALQHDALLAAGCERICVDKASGKLESRHWTSCSSSCGRVKRSWCSGWTGSAGRCATCWRPSPSSGGGVSFVSLTCGSSAVA